MTRVLPVVRFNRYLVWLFLISFFFLPFLILNHQHSVPYEDVPAILSDEVRYQQYCYRVDQRIKTEKILSNDIELDPKTNSIPYSYSQWQSSPIMPRLLNPCEHAILMDLLSILIKNIFEKYNIPYMMMAATLLGSYTRHDLLPWDDDVDIRVSISDRHKLKLIIAKELSKEPYSIGLVTMLNERNYDKVFFTWCPRYNKISWRFPFIDIFYHDENSTHVWLLGTPPSCPVRRENVFPLVRRPFGSLWLYGPREPMAHFESRRMVQIETGCFAFPYSHKYEANMKSDVLYADCSKLKSVYPYVKRQCTLHECKEDLMLGDETVIHTHTYDYAYRTILHTMSNGTHYTC